MTRRKILGGCALILSILFFVGCPSMGRLYHQAYTYYAFRNGDKALEILQEIIKTDKTYTPAYILASLIYQSRREGEKAESTLRAAKQDAQPSAIVCFNLGNIYFSKGDYNAASGEYTVALAIDPNMNEVFLNRANARMMTKNYELALQDYEMFLSCTGSDHENVRALVLLLRKDLEAVGK